MTNHVLHEVKRHIAFFSTLVWPALAGGTSYFATSQTKHCFFYTFSPFVKLIKNVCFATSQTKHCSFHSPFPVLFSFFFACGPLFGACFATSVMEYCDLTIVHVFINFHGNLFFLMWTSSFWLFALKPVFVYIFSLSWFTFCFKTAGFLCSVF